MLILSTNVDQKLLETEFLIAICSPTGDKRQSKTLFLVIFDPCLLIVKSVFHCCLSGVVGQLTVSDKMMNALCTSKLFLWRLHRKSLMGLI